MDLTIALAGQAAKRGVLPRLPEAGQLLDQAAAWTRAEYPEVCRAAGVARGDDGSATLRVSWHPAAREAVLTADPRGRVTASATTTPVGPGYHTFVARWLQRLGDELEIAWDPPGTASRAGGAADPAAGDRRAAELAHLGWLRASLQRALELRRTGLPAVHLGTPPGVRFRVDAALATPLGPRDDAWLERAVAEPRVAADIWPWFADAIDARNRLARALCLLWMEVRWRRPGDAAERAILDEALSLLRRAYPLDPSLPFPWREWLELVDHVGGTDPMARQLRERASAIDPSTPLIGYRRQPVTVMHEGWALTVPGGYAERRTGEEWWGGEGGRSITLAATATGANGRPMTPEAFLGQVAADLGEGALDHRAGDVVGRARITVADNAGLAVGVVEGFAAVPGSGAAIRVEFDDPNDWRWAVEQWKGLRPA